MNFIDRLSNGWKITMNSLKVLKANKQLIIFPILSGFSLLMILGSIILAIFANNGWEDARIQQPDRLASYGYLLAYYVVNYFIVVFFNTALIHCTRLYFQGQEVSVREGLRFAVSRIGSILAWALFAGTVGTILRIVQERSGLIGKIISGIVGIIWTIATFFVVPVIAYEDLGPVKAIKRSSQLMREKWGESLGATFSFGLLQFIASMALVFVALLIAYFIHPIAGIIIGGFGILMLMAVSSAAHTIFISAVYHNITGDPVEHIDQQLVDGLFVHK